MLLWTGDRYAGGGSDISDGKHVLQAQFSREGRLPVCDLLTGKPIHVGIAIAHRHVILTTTAGRVLALK